MRREQGSMYRSEIYATHVIDFDWSNQKVPIKKLLNKLQVGCLFSSTRGKKVAFVLT